MTPRRRHEDITDLEGVLERIDQAVDEDQDKVTLGMVMAAFGARTFAPLLLLSGLVTLAPVIGDIPGVPTLMAVFVVLVAVQMLAHRDHVWLPRWLLNRSVRSDRLHKAMRWSKKPARGVDKLLRPRLVFLTLGAGRVTIALTCLLIAAAMPPMEFVPLTANGAGIALTAFGLAMIAHDGVLALFAFLFTLLTLGGVLWVLI